MATNSPMTAAPTCSPQDAPGASIFSSLIDAGAFWAGNYIVSPVFHVKKPDIAHAGVFLVADVLVRNGWFVNKKVYEFVGEGESVNLRHNVYISLLYVLGGFIWDAAVEKESVKASTVDNVIRAAVGLATNTGVDYFIEDKYYR